MSKMQSPIVLLVAGALATGAGLLVGQAYAAGLLAVGPDPAGPERVKTPGGTTVRVETHKFPSDPGWEWLMSPKELRIGHKFGGSTESRLLGGYSVVDAEGGALRIYFVQVGRGVHDSLPPRLVILDAAGRRYLPAIGDAGAVGNPTTQLLDAIFTLDPKALAPDKAAYVGVEQRTPQAR